MGKKLGYNHKAIAKRDRENSEKLERVKAFEEKKLRKAKKAEKS